MSLNQKTDRPGFGVTSTLGDRFVILFGALGLISLHQASISRPSQAGHPPLPHVY